MRRGVFLYFSVFFSICKYGIKTFSAGLRAYLAQLILGNETLAI
jgi:hypothetical protein